MNAFDLMKDSFKKLTEELEKSKRDVKEAVSLEDLTEEQKKEVDEIMKKLSESSNFEDSIGLFDQLNKLSEKWREK